MKEYQVIWTPQPKQAIAMSCPATELFFGGAAGGGKSDHPGEPAPGAGAGGAVVHPAPGGKPPWGLPHGTGRHHQGHGSF